MDNTKADTRGFPPWWHLAAAHPAGSKSIRRNCDVSPIAILVDHGFSIPSHRLLCWIMSLALSAVTKITFCHATPGSAKRNPHSRWWTTYHRMKIENYNRVRGPNCRTHGPAECFRACLAHSLTFLQLSPTTLRRLVRRGVR